MLELDRERRPQLGLRHEELPPAPRDEAEAGDFMIGDVAEHEEEDLGRQGRKGGASSGRRTGSAYVGRFGRGEDGRRDGEGRGRASCRRGAGWRGGRDAARDVHGEREATRALRHASRSQRLLTTAGKG